MDGPVPTGAPLMGPTIGPNTVALSGVDLRSGCHVSRTAPSELWRLPLIPESRQLSHYRACTTRVPPLPAVNNVLGGGGREAFGGARLWRSLQVGLASREQECSRNRAEL